MITFIIIILLIWYFKYYRPQHPSGRSVSVSRVDSLGEVDCMSGHEFEYWCAAVLKANGFYNVSVTKGSGDQGVDVLASRNGSSYAIQCKCYSTNLGNTPVQEVYAGKQYYNCDIAVVMTNRYFTKGAQELARKTGVILWDRNDVARMMQNWE